MHLSRHERAYITKPIRPNELFAAIESVMAKPALVATFREDLNVLDMCLTCVHA